MSEPAPKEHSSDPSAKKADGSGDAQETDAPLELTPEEQMALYEKSLKEDDWGHQPC